MKFFLFIICMSVIFFHGCKPDSNTPCRAPHIYPIGFNPDDLSKFPFADKGDTLKYISLNGDSIWCIGANKVLYYKTFPVKNNPECPDDSIGFTILQFNYADSLNKLRFTVTVSHFDSMLTINANGSLFNLPLIKVGVNDSLTYFDSLQFGNKMFYKINSYVSTGADSLYYSAGYGMIALKQGSQHFYIYSFNNK